MKITKSIGMCLPLPGVAPVMDTTQNTPKYLYAMGSPSNKT